MLEGEVPSERFEGGPSVSCRFLAGLGGSFLPVRAVCPLGFLWLVWDWVVLLVSPGTGPALTLPKKCANCERPHPRLFPDGHTSRVQNRSPSCVLESCPLPGPPSCPRLLLTLPRAPCAPLGSGCPAPPFAGGCGMCPWSALLTQVCPTRCRGALYLFGSQGLRASHLGLSKV